MPPRPSRRAPHPHLFPIAAIPRPPRSPHRTAPHRTGGPGRPHRGRAGPGGSRRRALQAARPAERSRPLRRGGPATAGGGERPRAARPGSARLTCTPPAGRGSRVSARARGLGPARPCVGASASAAPAAPGPHRRPPPRRRRHFLCAAIPQFRRRGTPGAGTRGHARTDARGRSRGPAAQRRAPRPTDGGRGRGREGRPAGAASTLPGQRGAPRPSPNRLQPPAVLPESQRGDPGPSLNPLFQPSGVLQGYCGVPGPSLDSPCPPEVLRGVPGPYLDPRWFPGVLLGCLPQELGCS